MYRYRYHQFRPTETVDAVIRLLGRHNLTHKELAELRLVFNELNGEAVPKPGMTFKIPQPLEAIDDFGNVLRLPPPEPLDAERAAGMTFDPVIWMRYTPEPEEVLAPEPEEELVELTEQLPETPEPPEWVADEEEDLEKWVFMQHEQVLEPQGPPPVLQVFT